jgi:hypothetical protein
MVGCCRRIGKTVVGEWKGSIKWEDGWWDVVRRIGKNVSWENGKVAYSGKMKLGVRS